MPEAAALWKKQDDHAKRLSHLETVAEVHEQRLNQHTQEFRAMNKDAVARHTEINHTLGKHSEDMREFVKVYHEQQGQLLGATRVGKWGIGVMLTIVGLGIAYLGATS